MTYFQAMGWVDDAYFTMVGNVAKPKNPVTLGQFKVVQRELNRFARHYGYSKISEDGDIGPSTVNLLTRIPGSPMKNVSGAKAVANVADTLGVTLRRMADALPSRTSGAAGQTQPITGGGGGYDVPITSYGGGGSDPSLTTSASAPFGEQGTAGKLVLVGALGVAAYFFGKELKKGKRSSSSRRTSRRSTRRYR